MIAPVDPTAPLPPLPPQPDPDAGSTRGRGGRVVVAALLVAAMTGATAGVGATLLVDDSTSTDSAANDGQEMLDLSAGQDKTATPGSTEAAASTALPSVVKIYASSPTASGTGSGIVLTGDGEILTNNHVVEPVAGGGDLAVSFADGTTAAATVVGTDPQTDLAVIKAQDVRDLRPATLGDSDQLDVGEEVIAVGAPFGLESTVTTGIVSALNRPVSTQGDSAAGQPTVFPAIQTDAAINPGNSGGPLINLAGEVIGIDSAIRTDSSSVSGSGGSIGLGFAIAINDAIPIVEQLRDGKSATHARIGIGVGDAADDLGLPGGATVQEVSPGTAAAGADLRRGNVIIAVDGYDITDSDTLVAIVRTYRPGDTVTLTVADSAGDLEDTTQVTVTLGSDESE